MASLEGKEWSWYERLPSKSLYSLADFHSIFYEHFKYQYPSLLLVRDCCMHVKSFIENLEILYGDDDFMDEDLLYILQEYFAQRERQTNCPDIQENPQQLILSSLPEVDIRRNSDSTSHTFFPDIDENLQHSC